MATNYFRYSFTILKDKKIVGSVTTYCQTETGKVDTNRISDHHIEAIMGEGENADDYKVRVGELTPITEEDFEKNTQ